MDVSRIPEAFSFRANIRSLWQRPGERYAPIDGLRAFSMLWVVLAHICLALSRTMPYEPYVRLMDRAPWIFSWALHGEKALDTFFVISGFLIGTLLLSEHQKSGSIKLPRFYARRYLRLMPAYAVSLVILWLSHTQGPEKDPYVWANIFYVNNFLPQRHMFMDWSWSLAVEEQFYLLLPLFLLLVFFRSKHRVRLLVLLGLGAFAIQAFVLAAHPAITKVGFGEHFIVCAPHYSEEYFDALYVNLATRYFPFAVGVVLAAVALSHEAAVRAFVSAHARAGDSILGLGLVILVGLVAAPVFNPHVTLPRAVLWLWIVGARSVWSLGIALVMIAVMYASGPLSRATAKVLSARIWFPIAQLSYCSYLFHLGFILPSGVIVLKIAHPDLPLPEAILALDGGQIVCVYLLTLFFSFLAGGFIYLTVERPFLNLRPRESAPARADNTLTPA